MVREQRYGYSTKEFMEQASNGLLSSEHKDFRRWQDLAISLQAWTDKKEEHIALLLKMKR